VEGNPNFVPEVLIGWSAGLRQLFWRNLYVDVAAFHNQYDNIESYNDPLITVTFPTTPYPYESLNVQFANGLRGVSDGVELASSWKPVPWFEMRGSFSHVHVALHSKPGHSQASYATSIEGSSPHREASMQGIFTLPHGVEIVPDYRFVSALPAASIPSYQTADAHISWNVVQRVELAVTGRNLVQGTHTEITGDNSNAVAIRREVYGGLTWSW
jgi:iron complex outermembrane receptor protein